MLEHLSELNVDLCWHITDDCFALIGSTSSLRRISFTAIHLTDEVFNDLRKLPRLERVTVVNVDFHGWHNAITSFSEDMKMERQWNGVGDISYEKYQNVVLKKKKTTSVLG